MEEPDGLVSVNLLVVSAVSAFATGAIISGLTVCWVMSHRHHRRCSRGVGGGARRRKGGDTGGSVMSVTRTSGGGGGVGGGGGERRRHSQVVDNPFVAPNGWPLKVGDMDPDLLPTPEQTPLQQKRGVHRLGGDGGDGDDGGGDGSDWDQSQMFLTALGTGPCPSNAVIYLSSRYLQGGGGEVILPPHTERQRYLVLAPQRGEHGGGGGGRPTVIGGQSLRNSAGEYNYPATPQDSPDRRRVVSAPTPPPHVDYGESRWSHEALSYGGGGAPYPSSRGQQQQVLIRPGVHGSRDAVVAAPDYSHLLLGKGGGGVGGERAT